MLGRIDQSREVQMYISRSTKNIIITLMFLCFGSTTLSSNSNIDAQTRKIYIQMCQQCHGPRGKGDGPLGRSMKTIKDFADPSITQKSDKELFQEITNGRPPMPGYKKTLSVEARWQLVKFIRSFK